MVFVIVIFVMICNIRGSIVLVMMIVFLVALVKAIVMVVWVEVMVWSKLW